MEVIEREVRAPTAVQNGGGKTSIEASSSTARIQGDSLFDRAKLCVCVAMTIDVSCATEGTARRRGTGLTESYREIPYARHSYCDYLHPHRQTMKRHFVIVFPRRRAILQCE